MPPKIMKQIIPSIITPITNLINNSLKMESLQTTGKQL